MGFTPLQTTDINKGFTPLAASDDLSEDSALPVKKGFTPVTQADATLPQGESDPVNKNNKLIPIVDNSPVASAAFNKIFVPPALPDVLPDVQQPVAGPQPGNFLSQFFPSANANIPVANLLEQDLSPADIEQLSGISSRDRNTATLINDLNNGVFGLTAGELNALPELIERGAFEDTGKLVAALSEMVPPEALEAVNDAVLVNELVNRETPTVMPEGASKAFAEGLFKGLTLNAVEPGIAENEIARQEVQGNDDIARLLKAGDKASDIKSEQRTEAHPVATFSGEAVGSTVPFIQGVNLLRAARVARGLAPVVNTPAGIVAEGAKVGGPLAFAFKPEDADKMSATEELAARSVQGGIGLVLGGALDFAGAKTAQALAPFMTKFFTRLKDKKLNAELEAEAKEKGFGSADEYVASATDISVDDSGRAMIRIKTKIADSLPGDKPLDTETIDANLLPDVDAPEPRVKTPADKRVQAQEFERLARATDDAAIRQELLRRAEVLSAEADGADKIKLTPKERFEQRRIIDSEEDDLITAIRKLGGIDTDLESDVRGRLLHLPRSGFGLPAIERPGVGRSLDDLAESLTELGYLRERDVDELMNLLSQAEDGTKIFSLNKQDFELTRGEEPPVFADTDWRWVDVDDATRSDSDFVIDTDSGTVVPSRPIDENDLIRIQEEEANAAGFFEKDTGPTEQTGGLPDTGTVRNEERLPDSVEGRAGDKPRADEGAGGLVSQARTTPAEPVADAAPGEISGQGQSVSQVETGSLNSAVTKVDTAADVAHLTAPIRKNAQEGMFSVITDGDGNVLRVLKVSQGDNVSTPANVGTIAASINNVDGAKRAWLVHNHPDGTAKQSPEDVAITEALNDVLDGSGVTSEGMVVVAPGGKFTHRRHDGQGEVVEPASIKPGVRDKKVPVSERKFKRSTPPESVYAFDTTSVREALDEFGSEREGVLLLNSQRQPVGFVAMTRAEMKALRNGEGGASARLLKAFDESNASGFAARIGVDDTVELEQVARNLKGFENKTGFAFSDVLSKHGGSAESLGMIDRNNNRSTFYANPFGIAIKETVRDIGLHPGQNAAAAFAGGVGGATTSDQDAGSAGWWVDVAQGAAIGTGASQLLRRTNLLGKGSIVDNWMSRSGDWIESLPLIGRGPADLREAKRKQRLMQQLLNKQTEDVGRFLAKNFTPDERAMMADLIENRGIVKDMNIIHRQAQALDDYLTHAAERMKKLGMLDESLETGGYLHRYYAKHLGLDKLFKEAKGQTLSGSYTIARGTDDVFEREFLSPRAAQKLDAIDNLKKQIEKLEGKNADLIDADTAGRVKELKQRLNDLRKVELIEYVGEQNGTVRSFMFMRDEVARVDSGKKPVLAQIADTEPGLDPRLGPVAPGVDKLSPTDRVWTLKGSNGKKALLHRDWTKAERQSWGEINDAGYRYVRGMAEVSHDLSLATLYDTIARRSDWVSDEPVLSGKWIQVPDTKVSQKSPLRKYGKLAGKYVRKDVWNGIRNYGRASFAPGPVGKVYRGLLNKWKLYKTVYNPVTHMNNVYSNLEMTYMAGYTPADIGNGLSHLVKNEKSKLWREARDNGLFGTDWSTSLIQQNEGGGSQVLDNIAEQLRTQTNATDAEFSAGKLMEFKEWWINSKNAVADADGPYKTGLELSRAVAAPVVKGLKFAKKPVDAASRSAQRLYRTEDELFKMAVYAAERKKGTSPEKAVEAAQQYFFDYNDLPEAMKIVRDFPIGAPFISYTYFAVPAIAKNIVQNPEKVIALVAGYEALNYWALTADGVEPGEYWPVENAEEVVSPEWDRGRSIWGAKNTVNLPHVDGYRLAMGRAHALGNPFMTEAGGRDKLPAVPYLANFWGSSFFGGNPLHSILDVVVNEDWKGKNIYEPGDPKEDKAKKIAAYLYQAWTPSNPLVPGSFHQTKIIEGLTNDVRKARQAGEDPGLIAPLVDGANGFAEALGLQGFTGLNRAENEILTRDAVLGSFGVKLRPIRIDQSVEFESSKINRGKSKIGKALAKQARLNAEGRITDKQFERSERLADRDFEKLEKKEDRLFDAEKFLKGRGRVK